MTEKELRKLGRTELLELLLAERKENEQLQAQLAEAQQKLESRALTLAQTGSIAEAAQAALDAGCPRNEVYRVKLRIQEMFEEE